jgi:hypothetical protein
MSPQLIDLENCQSPHPKSATLEILCLRKTSEEMTRTKNFGVTEVRTLDHLDKRADAPVASEHWNISLGIVWLPGCETNTQGYWQQIVSLIGLTDAVVKRVSR